MFFPPYPIRLSVLHRFSWVILLRTRFLALRELTTYTLLGQLAHLLAILVRRERCQSMSRDTKHEPCILPYKSRTGFLMGAGILTLFKPLRLTPQFTRHSLESSSDPPQTIFPILVLDRLDLKLGFLKLC